MSYDAVSGQSYLPCCSADRAQTAVMCTGCSSHTAYAAHACLRSHAVQTVSGCAVCSTGRIAPGWTGARRCGAAGPSIAMPSRACASGLLVSQHTAMPAMPAMPPASGLGQVLHCYRGSLCSCVGLCFAGLFCRPWDAAVSLWSSKCGMAWHMQMGPSIALRMAVAVR